ncbi:MAG: phosphatidylglycerophosphatase A, partial [Deltaproteobacteria bacterium]|nr:phosphatidylglycerophosphatase A [Deltaproteobacteria bacterium]
FAILIAHYAEKILKKNDPGCIIIDEIIGIVITFIGLKFDITSALTGFIIFRFFDILKPFPIRFLEKKVPGGAGVVIDDIMAGVYSNIVLRVLLFTIL